MNPWTISRTALFIFLMTTMAAGADKTPPTYHKGTILNISRNQASCELEGIGIRKLISACGNFQSRQPVDYRLKGARVYIRRESGNEYKCSIEGMAVPNWLPVTNSDPPSSRPPRLDRVVNRGRQDRPRRPETGVGRLAGPACLQLTRKGGINEEAIRSGPVESGAGKSSVLPEQRGSPHQRHGHFVDRGPLGRGPDHRQNPDLQLRI